MGCEDLLINLAFGKMNLTLYRYWIWLGKCRFKKKKN